MEEHLNIQDGVFKGLWAVKGEYATGADMWDKIENIISAYAKLHPIEMELQVRSNIERTKEQLNDYGSNRNKNIRYGLSMPVGLMFSIQRIYPEIFEDQKLLTHFMKKFKGLRICKTV